VQVVAVPAEMLVGLHASDTTVSGGVTVTVAVVLPPSVAVTIAVCAEATEAAVAAKAAEVAAAGTVTDAGTGKAVALLDARATRLPPAGAA
jgi:hypothetical protein